MRIVITGPGAASLGRWLAERLELAWLPYDGGATIGEVISGRTEGFVLHGFPTTPAEAVELDRVLHRQAAPVDAALHLGPEEAYGWLVDRYRDRIVEVDMQDDPVVVQELALDRLREALAA